MKIKWTGLAAAGAAIFFSIGPAIAVRAAPRLRSILTATGLDSPVDLRAAPGDRDRLFILEQPGKIRIWKRGQVLTTPFLDIESEVLYEGERGLLSLAFHPDYASNGYFYLHYTSQPDGTLTLRRYTVSADPDLADPSSAFTLLTVAHPRSNHNGGTLAFGPQDGYLYLSLGDGGGAGDPDENSQDPGTLPGSILRLDVDWSPYTVPPDNPFVDGDPATRDEIWAYGLRNPWRMSFDSESGDLYIADVGQSSWEEINWTPAASTGGENYGWDCYEGDHAYTDPNGDNNADCGPPGDYRFPVLEYPRTEGRSVTGGYVYRGSLLPRLRGRYFYGDFITAFIRSFRIEGDAAVEERDWTGKLEPICGCGRHIDSLSSFGQDNSGELYLCDHDGEIYKITPWEGSVSGGDYNGDGLSDIAVFRGSTGLWAVRGVTRFYFGGGADLPAAGDFDGNGTTEAAVFRPAGGLWAARGVTRFYFGSFWDQPVSADFDGDGRTDGGIYRGSTGLWAVRGITRFYYGSHNDRPVPADYGGTGTAAAAVYRGESGLWAIRGQSRFYFGGNADLPLPFDFNGDGTPRAAVFRPEAGLWRLRGGSTFYYGQITDSAAAGDYDGDGSEEAGIFREGSGLWAIRGLTRVYYGGPGDLPATR